MFSATNKNQFLTAYSLLLIIGASSISPIIGQPADQVTKSNAVRSNQSKLSPEDGCVKLFQKYVIPLQDLWNRKAVSLKAENTDGYSIVQDLTESHCRDEETRAELIATLSRILNLHSGKIAIILPITKHPYLRTVIKSFDAHATALGLDPNKLFIVYDSDENIEKTYHALASAVFEHKVTAIIGGNDPKEASFLTQWAGKLMLPTFILGEPNGPLANRFTYFSYPTQQALAKTAVQANLKYGHKKVSILVPADQRNAKFVSAYNDAAKAAGIMILHQVPYDSKRFNTMESAAKKIFRLDAPERRDELKKLYETAKLHSLETGTKFNPKMIALQPDIQQDAVLIPDSFRIVRHFAKILMFLGVRKLPLFGHFEWRSKGLVKPWDPFLANAYFVDFQGLYSDMPESIRIQGPDYPFFAAANQVEQADFAMLGWKAVATPLALANRKDIPRRKMDQLIPRTPIGGNGIRYDTQNVQVWNGYLFKVIGTTKGQKNGTIGLVSP
jgi:hypothetical protein